MGLFLGLHRSFLHVIQQNLPAEHTSGMTAAVFPAPERSGLQRNGFRATIPLAKHYPLHGSPLKSRKITMSLCPVQIRLQ